MRKIREKTGAENTKKPRLRVLALAVIFQAMKDARLKGEIGLEARLWLIFEGVRWFEALGADPEPLYKIAENPRLLRKHITRFELRSVFGE
ncbi:MAG: hypothetical protein PVF83_12490 [Anaerolineales bacterium]